MFQLLKNVLLGFTTVWHHLGDDPVVLCLQVSRRLPMPAVLYVARWTCAAAPRNSAAVIVLLAALILGDHADVARRLNLALDGKVSGVRARRLADIAIAASQSDLSDRLLDAAKNASGVYSTQARRLWHRGLMTDAVAALDTAGASRMHRERLSGELRVFQGFAPALPNQPGYVPTPGRVLHLLTNSLPHTSSGYAQRSHSMLLAQQEVGWDVLAVTRLGYPVQVGKLLARTSDIVDGVRYRRLLPAILAPSMDARLQQQANELLRVALEFKPAVLHTTTHYVNGIVVRAVAEALGIPWVYEVRGQLADTWASARGPAARDSERYHLFHKRETQMMRDADLVVTLGSAMKANIVCGGVPPEKVIIAPNAVGGVFLNEPVDSAAARHKLGLPTNGQYIGTVSSLVPYEGLDDLIGAFELLAPKHPDLRLLVVGDGQSLPSLKGQAERTGFIDRIIFTGRVSRDQAALYHQALDVFVVPRKDLAVTRSVTPLKPVEALACGRPVVASRLAALEEIVTDGKNGLLAVPEDRHDFAAKLERLLNSQDLRIRLGNAGRREVLDSRTWRANAATLNTAYKQLMEAPC
ncbi:glycosyltransferase family 4 protein [Arthrobacter sp. D1-29]